MGFSKKANFFGRCFFFAFCTVFKGWNDDCHALLSMPCFVKLQKIKFVRLYGEHCERVGGHRPDDDDDDDDDESRWKGNGLLLAPNWSATRCALSLKLHNIVS